MRPCPGLGFGGYPKNAKLTPATKNLAILAILTFLKKAKTAKMVKIVKMFEIGGNVAFLSYGARGSYQGGFFRRCGGNNRKHTLTLFVQAMNR